MILLLLILLVHPFDSAGPASSDARVAQGRTSQTDAEVRRIAMAGWTAARELAPKGGAVDLLGPVNVRLKNSTSSIKPET